jgi:hypothetical protein
MLALCAAPQAFTSVQQGHSEGLSGAFLTMWGLGEVLCLIYVVGTRDRPDWPLITNYILNLTFIGIIGYYLL